MPSVGVSSCVCCVVSIALGRLDRIGVSCTVLQETPPPPMRAIALGLSAFTKAARPAVQTTPQTEQYSTPFQVPSLVALEDVRPPAQPPALPSPRPASPCADPDAVQRPGEDALAVRVQDGLSEDVTAAVQVVADAVAGTRGMPVLAVRTGDPADGWLPEDCELGVSFRRAADRRPLQCMSCKRRLPAPPGAGDDEEAPASPVDDDASASAAVYCVGCGLGCCDACLVDDAGAALESAGTTGRVVAPKVWCCKPCCLARRPDASTSAACAHCSGAMPAEDEDVEAAAAAATATAASTSPAATAAPDSDSDSDADGAEDAAAVAAPSPTPSTRKCTSCPRVFHGRCAAGGMRTAVEQWQCWLCVLGAAMAPPTTVYLPPGADATHPQRLRLVGHLLREHHPHS